MQTKCFMSFNACIVKRNSRAPVSALPLCTALLRDTVEKSGHREKLTKALPFSLVFLFTNVYEALGTVKETVVPTPHSDVISIVPFIRFIVSLVTYKPRPAP